MNVTLVIDDQVLLELNQEAARQDRTVSQVVESALRELLGRNDVPSKLPPLPTFNSGTLVDVSDRNALFEIFDADRYRYSC